MEEKHKCPVCLRHTFDEYGSFDFCPVCGWCDDPLEGSIHARKEVKVWTVILLKTSFLCIYVIP